jgi:tetratricopeptide (TPR) repeat protein
LLKAQSPLQSRLSASEVEHLYVRLGQAYAFLNAWTSAQQIYEELLVYAQQHQLPVLVSMTLNRLAILAVQQGKDKSEVQALLEQAWQQAQSSSDQRTLAETAWNWTQIISIRWEEPKRALPHGEQMLELACAIPDQELQARSLGILGWIHILVGDFEEAIHQLEAALALYSRLSNEPLVSQELSLPAFTSGAPLTQPLTNRATEALCWAILSFAQMNAGQVQRSLASSYQALALSQKSKNVWTQVASMPYLTYELLEAGEYEEALGLIQDAVALARTFPLTFFFLRPLTALGSVYQAVQQWEEALAAFQEAVAVAERFDLGLMRVPALSRLCLHYAVAGEWEAASRSALEALAWRKHMEVGLIGWDFSSHYETEALLHAGQERQAREAVQRLGERLGSSRRFRIPYLRSLALLAEWDGHGAHAITHLREASELATDLGLPEEQWQIQARLAKVYEAEGETAQARTSWEKAATITQGLAQGIKDETLRARFLAGPQIQPVLQHAPGETS